MSTMWSRILAILVLVLGFSLGGFLVWSQQNGGPLPFRFGLDLAGGSHLVYRADTSNISENERKDSLKALRDVIERRTNLFGVAEPLVQLEKSSFVASNREDRLIVELPGVTDLDQAIKIIGETPLLDFRIEEPSSTATSSVRYIDSGITGRFIKNAQLAFGNGGGGHGGGVANEPIVVVNFNAEGTKRFAELTKKNVGNTLAIFLDGKVISAPVIRDVITGGAASISGGFTATEARDLVRNLNFGALPVPIELISTQSIGPSLGKEILQEGVVAGVAGLLIVMLFMIVWYRLPGLVAAVSLLFYVSIMLFLIKLIPITLTAAGIAGFILSVGMAVDANVLIFERMKEEMKSGKTIKESVRDGFARAWLPIRDGNVSSLIAAGILFWLGTPLIEGFALVFALGVIVSMFSAVMITKVLLLAIAPESDAKKWQGLFGSGFKI